jgi:hypothetical protein
MGNRQMRRRAMAAAGLWLSGTGIAAAAEWRVADIAPAGFVFVDMAGVQRTGDEVRFSTWTIRTSAVGAGIDNWKASSVADCRTFAYRDVQIDYFASAGFVERSESEPERSAVPDTMAFSKLAVACGHKPASDQIVADPYALVREHVRRSL